MGSQYSYLPHAGMRLGADSALSVAMAEVSASETGLLWGRSALNFNTKCSILMTVRTQILILLSNKKVKVKVKVEV